MIPRRARIRFAFLLASTVAALFIAEGALSLLGRATAILQARPSGFDERTKRQVITDLRAGGIDAFPSIQPSGLLEPGPDRTLRSAITINGTEVLPLGGVADKETVLCNETGQYVIYHSDEYGFHNPKAIWQRNTLEVAAVGDSFTHGACVPSEKNAVALIRKRYPGTLNLGMSRNGPLLILASIREYLPVLKPKVVVWLHVEGHDFYDLAVEKRSALLLRYLREETVQGLREQRDAVDRNLITYVLNRLDQPPDRRGRGRAALRLERPALAVASESPASGFFKLAEIRRLMSTVADDTRFDKPSSEDWLLYSQILTRARDTIASWNGRLYLVYLPSSARYQALTFGLPEEAHRRVLAIAKGLELPVIDAVKSFSAHDDPASLFATPGIESRAAHYTEAGYQMLADAILHALAAETSASR